jgi:hypothetical protein
LRVRGRQRQGSSCDHESLCDGHCHTANSKRLRTCGLRSGSAA